MVAVVGSGYLTRLSPWTDPCTEGFALPAKEGSGVGSRGKDLISSAAMSSKMVFRSALPCPKRCKHPIITSRKDARRRYRHYDGIHVIVA